MNLSAIQAALVRWVNAATGLETRIAEQESTPSQPAGDYCTVRVGVVRGDGSIPTQSWRVVPDAPAGQDLEVSHSERPLITVAVQAYTAASQGDSWAVAVLEKARQALVLATVRAEFKSVGGLAVHRRGDVRNLNAVSGPRWQGRAMLELEVNVVEVVTERTTYIETADVSVVEGG